MLNRLLSHDLPRSRWLALALLLIVLALAAAPFSVVVLCCADPDVTRDALGDDAAAAFAKIREALLAFAHDTGQTEKRLTPAQVWDGSLMKTIFAFDRNKLP